MRALEFRRNTCSFVDEVCRSGFKAATFACACVAKEGKIKGRLVRREEAIYEVEWMYCTLSNIAV
jgi:hypothetical protein